jgi:hypothetical protein
MVIRVGLVGNHVLDVVPIYHDFPEVTIFLHPLQPLDQSQPHYGNLRALSNCPVDQSMHQWPLPSGSEHLPPHFETILIQSLKDVLAVDARCQCQAKLKWKYAQGYYRH